MLSDTFFSCFWAFLEAPITFHEHATGMTLRAENGATVCTVHVCVGFSWLNTLREGQHSAYD